MTANEPGMGTFLLDPDDPPELDDDFFKRADRYNGERFVAPGLGLDGLPKVKLDEVFVSQDVAEALKRVPCWQTSIDDLLRKWAEGGVRFVRPARLDEDSTPPKAAE